MRTMTAMVLIGVAAVAGGSPAFAGRDESQMMQMRRAAEVVKAERLAQAEKERAGMAGSIGVPGKPGPGTRPAIPTRYPGTHP